MNTYTLRLTEPEMAFFRELFASKLAVTLDNVEVLAELNRKIRNTKADEPAPSTSPDVAASPGA